jgi:cell wall-associated protease
MKKLLGLTCLFALSSAYAGNYVVEMKKPLSTKEVKELQSFIGATSVKKFTTYESEYFNRLYVVETKDDTNQTLARLNNAHLVKLVEKDFTAEYFEIKQNPNSEMTTNDLLFPKLWGLYNQEPTIVKQMPAGPVSTKGVRGYDVDWKDGIESIESKLQKTPVVAVVDMGIDPEHPELKENIFKNKAECDEEGNVPTGDREDRDGNKLSADCSGWNFAATDPIYQQFPLDDKGHGTHIAGIIAAKRNNDLGIAGVSDKIQILPIRVTGRVDETSDRNKLLIKAPSVRIANGILYAVKMKVDAINLSLGWPKSMDTKFMRNVITEAIKNNISVVAAAGNNNTNASIYPCAYYDVICVGSINADGKISEFSNYGGEVDILAPGDQILSTIPTTFIPLKMNIQGYDILSGTSQAAPFVTATAALLKGVYPGISNDEVMRRLFDSAAKKQDEFKSLHGHLQIQKAFEIEKGVSIKPIFKQRADIVFNAANGTFQFPLNFKNFGTDDTNIKIQIRPLTDNIKLVTSEFQLEALAYAKPASIKIMGGVTGRNVNNMARFEVIISSDNMTERKFQHEMVIAKAITTQTGVFTTGFKFVDKPLPLGFFDKEGRLKVNLRTIDEPYPTSNFPDFYVKHQPKEVEEDEQGITLYFLQYDGRGYLENPTRYFVKDAVKLLQVRKQDFNYDGKPDFLIKTIVKPKEGDGYILYSYRDKSMQPLLGKYSDIRYAPKVVNVTPKTVRYIKSTLPNGQHLAKPVFVSLGGVPDADQVNDEWTRPDRSKLRRVYELSLVDGDIPQFEARTFMNLKFVDEIRSSYENQMHSLISSNDTTIEVINLLSQNEENYKAGKVEMLASVGLGYHRHNIMVTIGAGKREHRLLDYVTQRLEGNAHHKLITLDGNKVSFDDNNAYIGFMTNSLVNMTNLHGNSADSIVYRERNKKDRLLSFLAQFEKDGTTYSFLETIDNILMVTTKGNEQTTSVKKTRKFSFLPGHKMSEIYLPIVVRDNRGNMAPAIYVDATQVSNNHVYVSTLKDGKLSSPVHLSTYIPNNCKAMNPVKMNRGNFAYSILCLKDKKWNVMFWEAVQ